MYSYVKETDRSVTAWRLSWFIAVESMVSTKCVPYRRAYMNFMILIDPPPRMFFSLTIIKENSAFTYQRMLLSHNYTISHSYLSTSSIYPTPACHLTLLVQVMVSSR